MSSSLDPTLATVVAPVGSGRVLVAVDGLSNVAAGPMALRIEGHLRERFPGHEVTVGVTTCESGEISLRRELSAAPAFRAPSLALSGVEGQHSALRAVLEEAVWTSARVVALVSAEAHDDSADWLGTLLGPILDGGFDFVSPAYLRHKGDAAINTGIVYPLTRALYGRRLRQPLGGEAALSLPLATRLLEDADWGRDPATAGSDGWLVAKVLATETRACQAWLGAWPRPDGPTEDPSQTLARILGMLFREMERHAARWQRVEGSAPLPTFGEPGLLDGGPQPPIDRFVAAFQLGERELASLWGLVLSPGARVALRRAAAVPERFRLDDATWARNVYDFAVAHFARLVERRQLLLSMTPLYLGWAASFAAETHGLDVKAIEDRVEQLCRAFEQQKRYLISRWRWPDSFNP